MTRKTKSTVRKRSKPPPRKKPLNNKPMTEAALIKIYPSLAESPTPAERRAAVEKLIIEKGIKPISAEMLDAMGDVWPKNENLDDFLAWRKESRRTRRSV